MIKNCVQNGPYINQVAEIRCHRRGLCCPLCHLLLRSPDALSLAFSHSQTTLVLIKPGGLTFSPRYLECCTESILRPCQAGNKPLLFPFWDFFLPLFCKQGEWNKLKLAFPAAQYSSPFLHLYDCWNNFQRYNF